MIRHLLQVSYEPAASAAGDDLFARFLFPAAGSGDPHGSAAAATDLQHFDTGVPMIGAASRCETWRYPGPVETMELGGLRIVTCDDYLLAQVESEAGSLNMEEAARHAYEQLLHALRTLGHPHVVKAWNLLPQINAGEADSECYQRFCSGRGAAFDKAGMEIGRFPAATAVGVAANEPMRVFLLASSSEPQPQENPRQVSAYRYPRRYGERSPSFARATTMDHPQTRQFILSGTAAIVGHESRFPTNVSEQAEEMLRNADAVINASGFAANLQEACADPRSVLRLYLRDAADADAVANSFSAIVPPERMLMLVADICRSELTIEMDAILYAPR